MAYIYKITNNITNKIYIGCTIKDINKRFSEHIYRAKTNTYKCKLYNSMNKHGIENFIIEKILECSEDEMFYFEIEFIKQFDSYNTGYNSTIGGEGCLGYKHSEETLIKLREICKQKTEEYRIGKSYEEIYSEDRANEEREKRSKSGKEYWDNCSIEEKEKRITTQVNTMLNKSGYTKELIYDIRKLRFEDKLKAPEIQKIYTNLTIKQIYNIIDKRKWKTIYEVLE